MQKDMPLYTAGSFKQEFALEKRKLESDRIRDKYPDRIPIILEQCAQTDFPETATDMKRKYLVPGELTMGQFMYVVRKRMKLNPEKAVFLYTNLGRIAPSSQLLGDLYNDNFDKEDGFLYLTYGSETTFGQG